ncbi:MAG TPA: L,D-transpeptidase [Aggregatilineales bacterium]|nr:L,D-transpeptidase [Aggregatilineales bacterium]
MKLNQDSSFRFPNKVLRLLRMRYRLGLFIVAALLLVNGFFAPNDVRADDNPCPKADTAGCTFGLPSFQYEMLLTEMIADPAPRVTPISVDTSELGVNNAYRIVGGTAPYYDAPNGKQLGAVDPGFYPVNVLARQGDWVQIFRNGWLPASDLTTAAASTFAGVMLNGAPSITMAWVLVPTRPSSFPGADPDPATPMLERYQRVNLYASITLGDWDWYLVGPGQWIEQRRVARVLPVNQPEGVKGHWIAVDLYDQVLTAYDGDKMIYTTLVSTGIAKPGMGTNHGLFRIWGRFRASDMSGDMGGPDAYNLPQVPYVMFFDGAISLHGTYWHDGFGYRHSHGCVNLSIADAHWIYDWTSGFYADTWVYVTSSREYVKYMPPPA